MLGPISVPLASAAKARVMVFRQRDNMDKDEAENSRGGNRRRGKNGGWTDVNAEPCSGQKVTEAAGVLSDDWRPSLRPKAKDNYKSEPQGTAEAVNINSAAMRKRIR